MKRALGTIGLLVMSLPMQGVTIEASLTGFTAAEQAVVAASVAVWEQAIRDPFPFAIDIAKLPVPGDTLAFASGFEADAQGRPRRASLTVDDRAEETFGWFVDSTPFQAEEYRPTLRDGYYGPDLTSPALQLYDLFTVVNHELGHALGFTVQYPRFASRVQPGMGALRQYQGDSFAVTLSAEQQGTHVSDSFYPYDLMVAFTSRGDRRLPSQLDLRMLADAYGYAVAEPLYPVPEVGSGMATGVGLGLVWVIVFLRWFRDSLPGQ